MSALSARSCCGGEGDNDQLSARCVNFTEKSNLPMQDISAVLGILFLLYTDKATVLNLNFSSLSECDLRSIISSISDTVTLI